MSQHPHATGDLAWTVHHLAVAAAELDAAIARRMGLTAGDYLALKHLAVSPAPVGPVELGRMLGMTSGAATGLVDRLVRAGYARREPHLTDRRRQTVTTTPLARERLLDELRPLADDIASATARLTDGQRRTVAETLDRLATLHRKHAR
ncbi:MarR family winged helix-turn-helix transcriptional regulator [Catenuloplanes atrovinosus]|uniref:DNA-binding MarR family transcriptional regulator n=1 Tax=Catenuloplanes atrovinosus TaxID=137266 RepID=A0AAE3YL82_9ACTN|nr:MarR family winged helix-turn-helix transcriptional regulator [Catenuloplanes atrovinosus]MDR7275888.1 DNA-binding MarR family transcriptional regulator [Catenuloplanes atrovinosus]